MADKNLLHIIESTVYRDHVIKIARRGDSLRVLIYPPGEMLAADIVEARISDYENAIMLAKSKIDQVL